MAPTKKKTSKSKSNVKPQSEPPSSPVKDRRFILKRGKACLVCRTKKIKCDGVRPECFYCNKFGKQCIFDDPETWGKQRQLQFKVENLEVSLEAARQESRNLMQILEDQKDLNRKLQIQVHPMLFVHHEPVLGLTFSNTIPQLDAVQPLKQQDFGMVFDSPDSLSSLDLSPLSSIESLVLPDVSPTQGQECLPVDLFNFSQSGVAPSAIFDVKLTEKTQSILFHASLPHLSQCCLDISKTELLSRFNTQGGARAIQDCLLYALFTVSCRFSTEKIDVRQHEHRFRQRVQFALRPQPFPLPRQDVFDFIRATLALAMYFYMDDCLKEASTHIAVAFGYLLELDKTSNRHPDICVIAQACDDEELLVVQCAYIVDRFIATQIESLAFFPEKLEQIFRAKRGLNNLGPGLITLRNTTGSQSQPATPSLSAGGNRPPLDQSSLIQFRVRCASLMYKISQLEGMKNIYETNALFGEARELRNVLPSIYVVPSSEMASNVDLSILSMHTQVFVTLTKLAQTCPPRCGEKCLDMAGEVTALVHELRDEDFAHLDPIIGLCWEWTIDAILKELSSRPLHPDEERLWITRVQFILVAMKKFAAYLPVVCVNIANISFQCCAWKITL